jgi:hypothetical protein
VLEAIEAMRAAKLRCWAAMRGGGWWWMRFSWEKESRG